MPWHLIDDATGLELLVGMDVRTSRDEPMVLADMLPPHRPESSGRVWLRDLDGLMHMHYPSVINATFVLR